MKRLLLAALPAFWLIPYSAEAQTVTACRYNANGVAVASGSIAESQCDASGRGLIGTGTGTGTPTAVTVGVSSAQALAAATRTQRLVLQNVSATASIACSLGGTAALNTAGSFQLGPGQMLNLGDNLYIPGDAVNCIASAASTPLTAWSR